MRDTKTFSEGYKIAEIAHCQNYNYQSYSYFSKHVHSTRMSVLWETALLNITWMSAIERLEYCGKSHFKFTAIHVKNTYQICNPFSSWMSISSNFSLHMPLRSRYTCMPKHTYFYIMYWHLIHKRISITADCLSYI